MGPWPWAPHHKISTIENQNLQNVHGIQEEYYSISFGYDISLTYVLFVDDIIMVTDGSEQSLSSLYEILLVYYKASGM